MEAVITKAPVAVVVILEPGHETHWDEMHRHIFTVIRAQLSVVMLSLVGWSVVQLKVALLEWPEELSVEQLSVSVSQVEEMETEAGTKLVPVIVQEVMSVVPVVGS
ncbi:hypothetical protein V5028_23495 [Enterobacter hormaechei]|uniref:hypothetical protein n=1 Tax=Enterobacter hormaechei TaxID=158836 RepID=UPI00194ECA26|nr:hypothetical protein [Enterobacter hormaechei]EEW0064357.1 hypothetical protein [Escherichia coli]EFU8374197.1 hypothetical protein [Escherichia coli]EJM2133362.1 hypothetical protein [Escherichia coli]MBM6490169.1 hypothetical protein [Enterobacter hormaechei]